MATMLSLRLTAEQEQRLTALVARRKMTRSEWLRAAIDRQMADEDAALDGHGAYLALTAALPGKCGSGRRDGARRHSEVLKQKLHASRRR